MESSGKTISVTVELPKREVGGLGFILKKEATSNRVLVGNIVKGSVADETGLLQEGDVLLEAGGVSLGDASLDETRAILANIPTGDTVKLKLLVEENDRRLANGESLDAHGNSQTTPLSLSLPNAQPSVQGGTISSRGVGIVTNQNHAKRSQELGKCNENKLPPQNPKYVELKNLIDGKQQRDTLHQKANYVSIFLLSCPMSLFQA